MSGADWGRHTDIGPELRQLAQTILDRLDPAVRILAARAAGAADAAGAGKCQQVWCPVCALAAFVNGEQHPLLTVIADHSVALLSVVRAGLDDAVGAEANEQPKPDGPDEPPPDDTPPPAGPGRYQRIPITVEE